MHKKVKPPQDSKMIQAYINTPKFLRLKGLDFVVSLNTKS